MEKAHKMQEKKKSISGRKTDKTGKPAIWQLRGRGFYAGNEKEEKNLQSVILDMVNRFGYLGILILIAVENVFPPIPSEVILTFGGFVGVGDVLPEMLCRLRFIYRETMEVVFYFLCC